MSELLPHLSHDSSQGITSLLDELSEAMSRIKQYMSDPSSRPISRSSGRRSTTPQLDYGESAAATAAALDGAAHRMDIAEREALRIAEQAKATALARVQLTSVRTSRSSVVWMNEGSVRRQSASRGCW